MTRGPSYTNIKEVRKWLPHPRSLATSAGASKQVFWASNALLAHNHGINAKAVRSIFDAAHVCTEDAGSQWIGDVLGADGLRLQKDQKQNYIPPDEGITPEYIVQCFLVPFDYQWDTDCEKYFPAAAALPPATAPTPRKTKKPRPPARPDADETLAEEADTALAEEADKAWVEGWRLVSEVCSTALAELQNVAHLLREALSEHPSLAEAESGLLTATQLLATARRVEDELIPQPEFLPEFPPAAVLMAEFLPNPDLGGGAAPQPRHEDQDPAIEPVDRLIDRLSNPNDK